MNKIIKSNSAVDEPLEKRELKKAILEKEKELNILIEEVEQLKIDLTATKQEYDVKVGRLYLKLDELDLEILKFKKIEDLINKGFSFEEAQKIVEETLKKRREQIKEEYKRLDEEEKEIETRKDISAEDEKELKKLWRKLAHKYHPDKLGGNEEMMKKINKAYTEGDLETLRAIDQSRTGDSIEAQTIEALKSKLAELETSIKKIHQEYELLKKSEWFILKENIEKAKKHDRDILSELADKVLSDIAKKENQISELKKKYGQR
jgi:DNA repair exonuclease SbcCD ATPase subunit